jgi:uncharacterized protein YdiU (UPF0061 family)
MRAEPQASLYQPDPRIVPLAGWLADAVRPAAFPRHQLRFRNQRWDRAVGLSALSGDQWLRHFGHFDALPSNLPEPLALRYHGHQFRNYNPELGDGRGFLFAQLRDSAGRLLDLGTKGSGQTPWSRQGDGRLTLKGAVREILATEMLEALGTDTSKTFSVIETGEELWRGDEPSPTRSAVLVRLSHGHIRIGTFQRLAALQSREEMEQLVTYCLDNFPGPPPPANAPGRDEPAVVLLHQVVERLADLAASYMVAGFVHGVLNSDNMNISGESFDYGPWRWLPQWDPSFTAAYFDHTGLYSFGRQGEAILWNCSQLGASLRLLTDTDPLVFALERFGELYNQALARRFLWRLGVEPRRTDADLALVAAAHQQMHDTASGPDALFFTHRGGRNLPDSEFGTLLAGYEPVQGEEDHLWKEAAPPTLLIEEVERIWAEIDSRDDWSALTGKIADIRRLGQALGEPPVPQGHSA